MILVRKSLNSANNILVASPVPALACALLAACSLTPPPFYPEPEMESALSEPFAGGQAAGTYEPAEWWRSFEDPALDRIVEAVLGSNHDLIIAVARLEQARAGARIASAAAFPLVRPSVGGNDFETPTNAGIGAQLEELGLDASAFSDFGLVIPEELGLTTFSLAGEFAYEVDFWGRNRSTLLAAGAERAASESDFLAARIGILAETIGTYIEIADLRRQRALAGENAEILEEREQLATSRYDGGLIGASQLYAVRRDLRNARAELPQLDGRLAGTEARLWVLLGGYREDLAGYLPDALSPSPAFGDVPTGVRVDLLVQRPDVGAARQRLQAARHRLGASRAALLPSLSLTGTIGLQSTDSNEWFDPDQWFQNLTMNVLGPAFQGARLRGNVALAEARYQEASAAWGRAVVTAVNEVEAALAAWDTSRRRHNLLSAVAEEARSEVALRERRYVSGVGGYEEFLAAAQILVAANSALAATERDLGLARLALHRALGGAWTGPGAISAQRSGAPGPRPQLPLGSTG